MPEDIKYGHVTLEHGEHIPEDEPVFVFRAKDKLLLSVLEKYLATCRAAGSPADHLAMITENYNVVAAWQEKHATKVPDPVSAGN